jgi:acetyl-CoA C-acetyltransferase
MNVEASTPVLVGCGQVVQKVESPQDALEPLELMSQALERAGEDCGAPAILRQADSIRVPHGVWDYSNPAGLLRERLGAAQAETGLAPVSGNMVQRMITGAALEIASGRRRVVLVTGAEAEYSKRRAAAQGAALSWTVQSDSAPDRTFGGEVPFVTRKEVEVGLMQPAAIFSLFENALRFARGESLEAHRRRISELWARFNAAALENPFAWTRKPLGPEEIRTPGPSNKMTAYPYTKLLCANMVVDQAAAVILCSADAARRLGIDPRRWVFPHAATDACKTPFLSNRGDLHSAPALARAGRRLFALAGVRAAEIEHVDLYSCFPAAVQLGAEALELPLERPLTVTGGLGFAGGPFNSYVLHSTAAMMDRLRASPGSLGLVTSIGGWLSRHALAVYSTTPPAESFQYSDLDPELVDLPTRELDPEAVGPATVESYALRYLGGSPAAATIACLRPDGRRAWATSQDPKLLDAMTREELCGRPAAIRPDGTLEVG